GQTEAHKGGTAGKQEPHYDRSKQNGTKHHAPHIVARIVIRVLIPGHIRVIVHRRNQRFGSVCTKAPASQYDDSTSAPLGERLLLELVNLLRRFNPRKLAGNDLYRRIAAQHEIA